MADFDRISIGDYTMRICSRIFYGLALANIVLWSCVALSAEPLEFEPPCKQRADLLDQLKGKYQEVPIALGLSLSGIVVEVTASPGGDTWSILTTDTSGMSCIIGVGKHWQSLMDATKGEPS